MAKRELSSTLKNLKFMQRAVQKQEKTKSEEEVTPDNKFSSSTAIRKKCIVIMEGNPHPGALKGRMSFQSFNPSIDKLNEEACYTRPAEAQKLNEEAHRTSLAEAHASSSEQDKSAPDSPNGVLREGEEDHDISRENSYSDVDHKRKQPETETEAHTPDKAQASASGEGDGRSSSKGKNGPFQRKREKLDWSVLRPPKPQTKRG
eukprot:TRINITY_DN7057_c0_g1_i1.p1 TRINITY_DN7057_c0_g1~~TRINITY_DN7057_c0_g1_i1.p1  ORF type:complete len:204 (-),score=41.10 TRINITY_DN7057_c0_g1_i1:387-998(-)